MRVYIAILASVALLLSCKAGSKEETNSATQLEAVMESTENAKRRVKLVKPVTKNGVRYEEMRGARSRGFEQNGGILLVTDESTQDELWTLQVYKTEYDSQEEKDVQDVHFTKLKINWLGTKLSIENERKQTFEIDIKDRRVVAK